MESHHPHACVCVYPATSCTPVKSGFSSKANDNFGPCTGSEASGSKGLREQTFFTSRHSSFFDNNAKILM